MAATQAIPEPMNSSPHHSKVKISTTLSDPLFVAGTHISGKLEMECRADRGLGIGILMVELVAMQELNSRDHSATSTFLHSQRSFQGPGLPPSNAVQAHPMPGDPPLPRDYYQARRGKSTFLFRIPLPVSSPSSISFGSGLANVRYELRASAGIYWKGERRLVVDRHPVDVVQAYPYEEAYLGKEPEAFVVGEGGKLWMQGKVVGTLLVVGESACLELQVKNHTAKKNSGLTLSLTRTLYLPGSTQRHPSPVQISDTLLTVPYRGPEYIIVPGAEGIANLVFDVPKSARGVRGGTLDGDESESGGTQGPQHTEALFEIKCKVEVRLIMGMGSKDIVLEVPVEVVHSKALPTQLPVANLYNAPYPPQPLPDQYPDYNPYYPVSPPQMPYIDPTHNRVWLPPPPPPMIPSPGYPYSPQPPIHHDHYAQPPFMLQQPYYVTHTSPQLNELSSNTPLQQHNFILPTMTGYIPRPNGAGPITSISQAPPPMVSGLPPPSLPPTSLLTLQDAHHEHHPHNTAPYNPEEVNGDPAFSLTQPHITSGNQSVSPQNHPYPLPPSPQEATAHPPAVISSRRVLPIPPPLLLPTDTGPRFPSSPTNANGVVHSPRPQLTPKHSFTRDPVLGTMSKSERVEELEKMADEVGKKSRDLSCDLPKVPDLEEVLKASNGAENEKVEDEETRGRSKKQRSKDLDADVNKTLPGPPVPSGKEQALLPPGLSPAPLNRPRADFYFSAQNDEAPIRTIRETSPLPKDQTPPTPALMALRQPRPDRTVDLYAESGLDALERHLQAVVGTRKNNLDSRRVGKDQRPDVRNVLSSTLALSLSPIDTQCVGRGASVPIPIPLKSPEPLNDSAISSLTLAGGLGDDSDGEFDGRTHRAGRSRDGSLSGDEEREGLHMHMHRRQRAEVGTPTKTLAREREKEKEKDKPKEGKLSGKKKERSGGEKARNKTAAKGRVAAWLGGIDPDIPPQEEVIPPSPSMGQVSESFFVPLDDDVDEHFSPPATRSRTPKPHVEPEPEKIVSAAPNPRSSGFVSIATLKRDTLTGRPGIAKDATVVVEARRVQDLWSFDAPAAPAPEVQGQEKPESKYPSAMAPIAPSQSIRTDRRVSPPSKPGVPKKDGMPMSYSAAARNVWKLPNPPTMKGPAAPPPPPPDKKPVAPARPPSGKLPSFPPTKPIDSGAKYDIRSARGGRGGQVTSVANLWASGAISDKNGKNDERAKELPNRLSVVNETKPPDKPLPGKKLFSVALMTPAPKRPTLVRVPSGTSLSKLTEAQKRPDSREAFTSPKPNFHSNPKRVSSATNLNASVSWSVPAGRTNHAAEGVNHTRPSASPKPLQGKITHTNLSTPSASDAKLHEFFAKGVKPAIKATSDPAVVSSSHATPTLSSTASLVRPRSSGAQKASVPVKLPAILSTPVLASPEPAEASTSRSRPGSPSKPADLAFGQARLRDLIKKYQGQGQKI